MAITMHAKGDFKKTFSFLDRCASVVSNGVLDKCGREGVVALASATPVDTGKTAESWSYRVTRSRNTIKLEFLNSNVVDGVPIAIILQYGHGTRNGGYVQGRDYINPAIRPIFDKLAEDAWKEVTQ